METKPIDTDKLTEAERAEPELSEAEYIIRRPKRLKLTPEESLKRMQAFGSERMENFIASVRKSKR